LYAKYCDRVDFLSIYIIEAHAKDEWPLGHQRSRFAQHKTLQDRIDAGTNGYVDFILIASAKYFIARNNYQIPMVVDDMSNDFEITYACWPVWNTDLCNTFTNIL